MPAVSLFSRETYGGFGHFWGVPFCCYNQLYKRGLEGARKAEDPGPKSLQPILTPEESTIMENLLWSMIGFDVTRDRPITRQSLYQGELWLGADQVRARLLGMSPRAGGSVGRAGNHGWKDDNQEY